ncbi:DDE-type integrase/transposase/recombinase [Escherichia coli]
MISNNYPKTDRIIFIKKTVWILPRIVRQTLISGVLTFYTDANKSGKAGYKAGEVSKVVQSPYTSVQKAELYAILLVLVDFTEPLNIVTDSQYAERVVLHIETAEFVPDNTELTSLFLQLQETIRNRSNPMYITHIRSHTGLPGPLAQGNDEIDRLLIGSVLEASEFHKKHHVNSKGLKKDFSITWQQAKEIVKNCPTCSFYNQTPLPAGCNPKGIWRNEVWQMDVFHFAEFGNLKYVHHTIDTFSGFQWATALNSEKADSVITHLLEVMAVMGIPAPIKNDNAAAYVSTKLEQFFKYYKIKHAIGIPHNPTGQAVVERSNRTLKEMLNKQAWKTKPPKHRLHNALLTLNFLNANEKGQTATERHWTMEKTAELNQPVYFKDVLTSTWKPGHVLRWGRGFALVSTGEEKLWIPSKLIKIRVEKEKKNLSTRTNDRYSTKVYLIN